MSSAKRYSCEHCGKKGFKSEASLHQHQSQNEACFAKLTSDLGSQLCSTGNKTKHDGAAACLAFGSVNPHSWPSFLNDFLCQPQKRPKSRSNTGEPNPNPGYGQPLRYQEYNNNFDVLLGTSNNDDAVVEDNLDHVDDSMHQQFRDYVKRSKKFIPVTHLDTTAITLLTQCRITKASLGAYESMCCWHSECNGLISPYEGLKTSPHFLAKEKVHEMLRERYNMEEGYVNKTVIVLPSTKAEAKIIWNDAKMVVQALLVEPRATPEDYFVFDEDPFAPLPEELDHIADLNTGKSYLET